MPRSLAVLGRTGLDVDMQPVDPYRGYGYGLGNSATMRRNQQAFVPIPAPTRAHARLRIVRSGEVGTGLNGALGIGPLDLPCAVSVATSQVVPCPVHVSEYAHCS